MNCFCADIWKNLVRKVEVCLSKIFNLFQVIEFTNNTTNWRNQNPTTNFFTQMKWNKKDNWNELRCMWNLLHLFRCYLLLVLLSSINTCSLAKRHLHGDCAHFVLAQMLAADDHRHENERKNNIKRSKIEIALPKNSTQQRSEKIPDSVLRGHRARFLFFFFLFLMPSFWWLFARCLRWWNTPL